MFVVHYGLAGHVIIHRSDCPFLEDRYYDGGWRHTAGCFADAERRAEWLLGPSETEYHVCGWCRPNAPH